MDVATGAQTLERSITDTVSPAGKAVRATNLKEALTEIEVLATVAGTVVEGTGEACMAP